MTLKSARHDDAVPPHDALKEPARAWFEALRDRLCAAFEAIEDASPVRRRTAGRAFERNAWAPPRTAAAAGS